MNIPAREAIDFVEILKANLANLHDDNTNDYSIGIHDL